MENKLGYEKGEICGRNGCSGTIGAHEVENCSCLNNAIHRENKLNDRIINWRYECHTHFSMKKVGVFTDGTTRAEVEKEVKGTFGGRFEYFSESERKFSYIAYTD